MSVLCRSAKIWGVKSLGSISPSVDGSLSDLSLGQMGDSWTDSGRCVFGKVIIVAVNKIEL